MSSNLFPGCIVANDATFFRTNAEKHKVKLAPCVYAAMSTAEHLMIVDQVENDHVWVYHVDKKPDGLDKPHDGRTLRRTRVPVAGLRMWHVQPSAPEDALAKARVKHDGNFRAPYFPGTFDCQTFVYSCAGITRSTPSQSAAMEAIANGVDLVGQAAVFFMS